LASPRLGFWMADSGILMVRALEPHAIHKRLEHRRIDRITIVITS
jgi:hypothetical protein